MCCARAGKGVVFLPFPILKFQDEIANRQIIAKIDDDDDVVIIIIKVLRKV